MLYEMLINFRVGGGNETEAPRWWERLQAALSEMFSVPAQLLINSSHRAQWTSRAIISMSFIYGKVLLVV